MSKYRRQFGSLDCDHENVLIERAYGDMTPEQRWCGKWRDCPYCYYTELIPSEELKTLWGEQYLVCTKEDRMMNKSETFTIGQTAFRAEFSPILDDRPAAKFDGKWILYKFTYHQSTWMRQVKRPRSQQVPRMKRVGVFDTLEQCKEAAEKVCR